MEYFAWTGLQGTDEYQSLSQDAREGIGILFANELNNFEPYNFIEDNGIDCE